MFFLSLYSEWGLTRCRYFTKDGKIEEYGTHDELVAKKGAYAKYVELQRFKA